MKPGRPHNNDFYFRYHRIGSTSYRDKVRFYEENRSQVGHLTYEERLDIDLDYALCLFEIGKYHKFLSKADGLIETVIMDNIFTYNEINIYNDLLFKKAACLFNTGQYTKSEKVMIALIKLEPDNKVVRSLYGKCKKKQGRDWYETAKAVAVVMLSSAILIAFAELFIVEPFYNDLLPTFKFLKWTTAILGLLALAGNELYLRYIIGNEIGYVFDFRAWRTSFKK